MVIYHLPSDAPESIIRDQCQYSAKPSEIFQDSSGSPMQEQIQKLFKEESSIKGRLVTLLGSFLLMIGVALFLISFCLSGALSLVFFRKFPSLNSRTALCFGKVQKFLTCAVGLFIATFSPPLGFGMLLVYSMTTNSDLKTILFKGFS